MADEIARGRPAIAGDHDPATESSGDDGGAVNYIEMFVGGPTRIHVGQYIGGRRTEIFSVVVEKPDEFGPGSFDVSNTGKFIPPQAYAPSWTMPSITKARSRHCELGVNSVRSHEDRYWPPFWM